MVLNITNYVPVLKSKAGEFNALAELRQQSKSSIVPLIEVIDNEEESTEAIEGYLTEIAEKARKAWAGFPCYIDSLFENDPVLSHNTHYLKFLVDALEARGIPVIPVCSPEQSTEYKNAVIAITQQYDRGVCIRLSPNWLVDFTPLIQLVVTLGMAPNKVDVLVDFGSIDGNQMALFTLAVNTYVNNLPNRNDWHNIILVSSAFPRDLSRMVQGINNQIPRTDWQLWNNVQASTILRKPIFGDYVIAHPEMVDFDPVRMSVSASIRYTIGNDWMIARGRSLKLQGYGQYHGLSQLLVASPHYYGNGFSWGDNYIHQNSTHATGTGSPAIWRKVANNHHMEVVVHQLSNLIVP